MGRTEANEKTLSDRTQKGGRRRGAIGSSIPISNERAAVRKPDSPSHQTENGMTWLKRSTTGPTVQSATPPISVHNALRRDRDVRTAPLALEGVTSIKLGNSQVRREHHSARKIACQ
jgi:hypothetical protein